MGEYADHEGGERYFRRSHVNDKRGGQTVSKVGIVFAQLNEAELSLMREYRRIGQRHATDHGLWHNCHTFARQSQSRAEEVRQAAGRYGNWIGEPVEIEAFNRLTTELRKRVAEMLGRRESAGTLTLLDLRRLHLAAERVNIEWIMLGYAAQVARDAELLEFVEVLHREVGIQIKWIKDQIEESTPQAVLA